MRESIAESINLIGDFCGQRDIEELSQEALQSKYGKKQADVMVLFGGSILCGGDVLAQAIRDKVANVYVIVGGEGHTTDALRKRMKEELPQLETDGQPEAVCFQRYIEEKYVPDMQIIPYAAYRARVKQEDGKLHYYENLIREADSQYASPRHQVLGNTFDK